MNNKTYTANNPRTEAREAFWAGRNDFCNGVAVVCNPYKRGTDQHGLWLEGWNDAAATRAPK